MRHLKTLKIREIDTSAEWATNPTLKIDIEIQETSKCYWNYLNITSDYHFLVLTKILKIKISKFNPRKAAQSTDFPVRVSKTMLPCLQAIFVDSLMNLSCSKFLQISADSCKFLYILKRANVTPVFKKIGWRP